MASESQSSIHTDLKRLAEEKRRVMENTASLLFFRSLFGVAKIFSWHLWREKINDCGIRWTFVNFFQLTNERRVFYELDADWLKKVDHQRRVTGGNDIITGYGDNWIIIHLYLDKYVIIKLIPSNYHFINKASIDEWWPTACNKRPTSFDEYRRVWSSKFLLGKT